MQQGSQVRRHGGGLGKAQPFVDQVSQRPPRQIPSEIIAEKIGHRIDPVF
jgi:hypothetical protein